jgi:hypothetical protein
MPIKVLGKTPDRPRREWNSPQRRKERQQQYMDKHGDPGPRRKRLTPRDATARDRAKKIGELHERMGGGEKAKPHSSKEGRTASGRRRLERFRKKAEDVLKPKWPKRKPAVPLSKGGSVRDQLKIYLTDPESKPKWNRDQIKGPKTGGRRKLGPGKRPPRPLPRPGKPRPGKPLPSPGRPLPKWKYKPEHVPARRTAKAAGGIAKVGKRFLDFIKTGKHVDKKGVKVNVPKAAERLTGKPHVDHGKRKRIKHLGKGKASGGRAGFRHGGSVGAAIRGYGAVIK